jgi:hypothetical protein
MRIWHRYRKHVKINARYWCIPSLVHVWQDERVLFEHCVGEHVARAVLASQAAGGEAAAGEAHFAAGKAVGKVHRDSVGAAGGAPLLLGLFRVRFGIRVVHEVDRLGLVHRGDGSRGLLLVMVVVVAAVSSAAASVAPAATAGAVAAARALKERVKRVLFSDPVFPESRDSVIPVISNGYPGVIIW